jgi:hypothetical protein
MIKKTTEAVCDNCGTGIYHVPENLSYKEFIKILTERNIAVVRYIAGRRNPYIFCNEKCFEEFKQHYDEKRNRLK